MEKASLLLDAGCWVFCGEPGVGLKSPGTENRLPRQRIQKAKNNKGFLHPRRLPGAFIFSAFFFVRITPHQIGFKTEAESGIFHGVSC